MARSGTINGNRSGTQPYLRISWSILSQDIPNNRSRVRLQLILVSSHSLHFSARKTGSNNGVGFTYTGGFSGTGTRTLNTRDIWVNHNTNGTRTQSVNGSFNITITWGGSRLNSLSVSGNMNLDRIPRASSLNSFSIGSHLRPSTSNTVRLSISSADGSFTHNIQLRDGSTVLQSWNGQGLPTSLNISDSTVNTLLNRMSNTTSRTLTLRVQTRSGSSNIGSAVTRTATATVHDNVQPSSSVPTASINGSGRDSDIDRYVQNISRVNMSASTFSAGYGASVRSRRLIIRHSSGTNVERSEHNGASATSPTLGRSGTYNIFSQVTDSRGRSFTSEARTVTVEAYSEPVIRRFRAERVEATPTSVSIRREGNHSNLGGLNPADIIVSYRTLNGDWQEISSASLPNHTGDSFGATPTSTGHSVTESYEFRLVVTDSFNNSAEATSSVSTQRVVLDIHKNEGVGIGKIHEQGALDVDGGAYFQDGLYVNDIRIDMHETELPSGDGSLAYWQNIHPGLYRVRPNTFPNQPLGFGFIDFLSSGNNNYSIMFYSSGESPNGNFKLNFNQNSTPSQIQTWRRMAEHESGSNSNGNWVRYSDGTQICTGRFQINRAVGQANYVTLPATFLSVTDYTVSLSGRENSWTVSDVSLIGTGTVSSSRFRATIGEGIRGSGPIDLLYTAIGRWK